MDGTPTTCTWGDFAQQAPALEAVARQMFERTEVVLVGTLRADGSPRITPVEFQFLGGELVLGMMPRSRKAADLLRDPRCVVHSAVLDKEGTGGDAKVYGRARELQGAEFDSYCDHIEAVMGWRPTGAHAFALGITEVAYNHVEGEVMVIEHWAPGSEPTRTERGND